VGRTVKTATTLLHEQAGLWEYFRRGLKPGDRQYFMDFLAIARRHSSAMGNSGIINPFEAIMLSYIVELEKRLQKIEDERNTVGCDAWEGAYNPLDQE
jgi:hypothetical protein